MRYLCMAGIIVFGAVTVRAEELKERILPVQEFVALAAAKDTNFAEILINELFLAYAKDLGLSSRDIVLSVEQEYAIDLENDDPGNSVAVGLNKLFPKIGTELDAAYRTTPQSGSNDASSSLAFTISQDIARNAFGTVERYRSRIIDIENDIALYQVTEAYEDYLAALITLYYGWYEAYENFNTAEAAHRASLQLLDNIRERQTSRIAKDVDVNKIMLQVFAKEESLVGFRQEFEEYRVHIRSAIRDSGSASLIPTDPAGFKEIEPDLDADLKRFNEKSRTICILNLLKTGSDLQVDRYANGLLPSACLSLRYGMLGLGSSLDDPEKEIAGGISLQIPIPSQTERASYKSALVDQEKTRLSNSNVRIRLTDEVGILFNQIQETKRLVVLADRKIALSNSIVTDETEEYSFGRTTLTDLIGEVDKLDANRLSRIRQHIRYKNLLLEWLRLTDTLIYRKDITAPESRSGK
ncbi:MAG: TolC family protein [bacterium]